MQEQLDRVRAGELAPPCARCGGIQRSATVAFGQSLDPAVLARLVIVNAEPTEYDPAAAAVLRGPIGDVLPAIVGAPPS
jgi:NAD-dependent deacetylase